jgi:hypothetical protein
MDQRDAQETGGLYFPMLISNLCMFVLVLLSVYLGRFFSVAGMYIQHLCLIGLFFLAEDEQGNVSHCVESHMPNPVQDDRAPTHKAFACSLFSRLPYSPTTSSIPLSIVCVPFELDARVLTSSIAVTKYLPMSLATHQFAERLKKHKVEGHVGEDVDLFSHDSMSH